MLSIGITPSFLPVLTGLVYNINFLNILQGLLIRDVIGIELEGSIHSNAANS